MGELDLGLQPKLLRVLESRAIKRVGGTREIPVDVRVIAATNRDLRKLAGTGAFREDLYYRLGVIAVELPALRERPDDIPALVQSFLTQVSQRRYPGEGRRFEVTPEAIAEAMLAALAAPAGFKPVSADGASRAARLIAALL